MNPDEMIQKIFENNLKNENSKIEELDKELFEIQDELKYCEKELLDLGFNPLNPDLIPEFIDIENKKRYTELLNSRLDLIKKINTIKGDLHIYKNSLEH